MLYFGSGTISNLKKMSFSCYILVLNFLVSQSTANKNASLKHMLARSLTKVRQMLVDIEKKVEEERNILSKIDHDLSQKGDIVFSDENLDYPNTDIWWTHDNMTTDGEGHSADDVAVTIPTTPSIIPKPPSKTTVYPTTPVSWIQNEEDHMKAAFLADVKQTMESDHHGYFTAFLTRFTELVYTKNTTHAYVVMYFMVDYTKKQINAGKFHAMDDILIGNILTLLSWFDQLTATIAKEQAGVLHFMLKANYALDTKYINFLNFYDNMFSKEEGEALFESLVPLYIYPSGNISVLPMIQNIFKAAFLPYFREEGRRKQRKLIQQLINVLDEYQIHPNSNYMRMSMDREINTNHSKKGPNDSNVLMRRSMSYKRILKHLLVKHPELFRKINGHIKHDKKDKHLHLSRKRKSHHRYSQNHDRHQKHRHVYKHELARRRAPEESGSNLENEKDERDYSDYNEYYSDKEQRIPRHRYQINQQSKREQWKRPAETISTTEPKQYKLQHQTQHPINFLRKKQQGKKTDKVRQYRQNFYRNGRRNIPSSDEETCSHSEYFQDSIENGKDRKIREVSSHSDEEDQFINNLHDSLRNGN